MDSKIALIVIGSRALCLVLLLAHTPKANADWPRFLGSDIDSTSKQAPTEVWTEQPSTVWTLEVGDGYGIGSVRGDRYYHFDSVSDSGQLRERLRCTSMDDASIQWSVSDKIDYRDMFGYEDGPRSSPTIVTDQAGRDLIVTMGVSGLLTVRNLNDGSVVWQIPTSSQYGVVQNFFGVACSPLHLVDETLGDMVVVMVGGSPPEDQNFPPMALDRVSDTGTALVAFALRDGRELWKTGNDLASYSSPRTAELDGRTSIITLARGSLWIVDAATGNVLADRDFRAEKLESVNAMVPLVRGDQIFVSECYEIGSTLFQFKAGKLETLWRDPERDRRRQSMRCHWATPVRVGNYLYGGSGRNAADSDFRCVEWSTGRVLWVDERRTRASVTLAGDKLLVLNERGLLQIVEPTPERFSVVAEFDLSASGDGLPRLRFPLWSAPVVVGPKVIVRGDRKVACFQWE